MHSVLCFGVRGAVWRNVNIFYVVYEKKMENVAILNWSRVTRDNRQAKKLQEAKKATTTRKHDTNGKQVERPKDEKHTVTMLLAALVVYALYYSYYKYIFTVGVHLLAVYVGKVDVLSVKYSVDGAE